MYKKQEFIFRKYREGKSQRQISRELGISRTTVKKYLASYEAYKKRGLHKEGTPLDYLAQPVANDSRKREKRRLTHKAHLVNKNGESYRIREIRKLIGK